jgi:hypothetical protein
MANDTFELTSKLIKGVQDKEMQARVHDYKIYKAPTMQYRISPLYSRYIGNTVIVAHNGNFKKFPVDGTEFSISDGHYKALTKYLRHVDKQISIAKTNAKFMGDNVTGDFKKL